MSRFRVLTALSLAFAALTPVHAAAQTGADAPTLVEKLAAGQPFILVTKRDAITLREGDWSYPFPSDYWIAFEGRYDTESGIWMSSGFGFNPNRNEFHACPPDLDRSRFICGGSHSNGYRMSRRLTPDNHGLVVLENELTFDDAGNVYRDDRLIGMIAVPPQL